MKNKILITEGINNDLDGAAGIYAYAEFLNKKGISAEAGVVGKSHSEAEFMLDYLKINLPDVSDQLDSYQEIRLVDACNPTWISPKIDINKITEAIDHRPLNESHLLPKAKCQIELVGAAATLVAEKFQAEKIQMSKESAWLIYAAIISNTINFKAKVTTDRDKKVAKWLKSEFQISGDFIHEMFVHKSVIHQPIKTVFLRELGFNDFNGHITSVFQLEIVEAEEFVRKNLPEITRALKEIKAENGFDLVMFTCVDVDKGFNVFVAADDDSAELISKALNVTFQNCYAKTNSVIMRKEINPKFKEYFEKNAN